MKANNPFLIYGYFSPEYFCDREIETAKMLDALQNERNLMLKAPRRMGKTGLIKNLFYRSREIEPQSMCFYMDIFSTQNLNDFVRLFAATTLGELDSLSKSTFTKITKFFKSCRPTISIDSITNMPTLSLDIAQSKEEATLKEIFEYLNASGKKCYIAIDEFQQIKEYPEKGVDALLRSYIQFTPNIHYIFSGSRQHLMDQMFIGTNSPFYMSTQNLNIDVISKDKYYAFAGNFFIANGYRLSNESFDYIYEKFEGHTWYIQCLLNRLYGYNMNIDNVSVVVSAIAEIVDEYESNYQSYIYLFKSNALKLLKAIAKEGRVVELTSGDFITKYKFKAASSVNTALLQLTGKDVVYLTPKGYIVYDRFLALWLKKQEI